MLVEPLNPECYRDREQYQDTKEGIPLRSTAEQKNPDPWRLPTVSGWRVTLLTLYAE